MSWGAPVPDLQLTNGAAPGAEQRVSLVVAGQPAAANTYYTAFLSDARFNVLAMATDGDDARAKVAGYAPEAVVLDATVFPDPRRFADAFLTYGGACFLLLPNVAPDAAEAARKVPCVAEVLPANVNLTELAGKIYAAALTRRRTQFVPGGGFVPPAAGAGGAATAMAGWRSVAVWSMQGGVGKSTLAQALTLEAASRRLPALLVPLAAPDMTPLVLGPKNLKPEPNIMSWRSNPTVDGLRAALQHYDLLDVLIGFRDPLTLAGYNTGNEAMEGNASLHNLANCAAFMGKAVIVLDVSAPELAAAALSAANTLVLVARPDLPGIQATRDAVRLVHEKMSGRHRIPPEATYLVVNRTRQSTFRAEEVARHGAQEFGLPFPALVSYVPDDPAIEEAVRLNRPAYYQSSHLRQAVKVLGDLLFAAPPAAVQAAPQAGKSLFGGLLRVRVRS
jgi:arsenite-transporting ATPase